MKLLPFNLKRALAGDPICTKGGRLASIIGHDNSNYPINARYYNLCTGWHCRDGKQMAYSEYNLYMLTKPAKTPKPSKIHRIIFAIMKDGKPRATSAVAARTGYSESSVSCVFRDFRKTEFGGHEVTKERQPEGFYFYTLTVREVAV